MTIHDNIDNFLAADLHGDLSEDERSTLHAHLVECADCRKAHQETKIMNKVLEENLANEKPDPTFEQRMLSEFRNRVPQKNGGLTAIIINLMRLRATQITAVAAMLLALFQVGRVLTREWRPYPYGEAQTATTLPIPEKDSLQDLRMKLAGYDTDRLRREYDKPEQLAELDLDGITTGKVGGIKGYGKVKTRADAAAQAAPVAPQEQARSASADESGDHQAVESEAYAAPSEEKVIVTGSNVAASDFLAQNVASAAPESGRKLIRNAGIDLEVASFTESAQKVAGIANEEQGYVASTHSQGQENGKLLGLVVVKVPPGNLDRFLQKVRGIGKVKNQTIETEDVTKTYFDTEARLKNARVMEQRLIEMLKTKTGKVSDLLEVEKELGRKREEIEKMQGDLKLWDSQIQFSTVRISLAEQDLEEPAEFLLKERAQLSLYTPEVEKIYNDIKAFASPKVQITNAQIDRDNTGRVSARISLLIAPEESDATISKVKAIGRVENFQVQTERVAQSGNGMSETARTKRDKVELNVTISRDEQEQSFQQTSLRIRTGSVDEKTKALRDVAEKQGGRVRSSTFSRDPDGREIGNVSLRLPMRNYEALMQSLGSLGKVENVSVRRQDNTGGRIDEANAPADLSIQVYSQGNIVSHNSGLLATLRRTIDQSASAIMWSLRMIGVAIAFLAPWVAALIGLVWIIWRVARARRRD